MVPAAFGRHRAFPGWQYRHGSVLDVDIHSGNPQAGSMPAGSTATKSWQTFNLPDIS
ncbi:hypothetical protein Thpro_021129 [Acidihalobacter prosperus]|uniref:Uncharacterized protein n=1 Tax=Acidihalobacter prosperus TaxID=160660 RepID=A0A1A6C684_9GAMM|nr:hypothetical protein Thpro_021129 [Acidihalobacter prosperus]